MTLDPCAWWHASASPMTPLEAIKITVKGLEAGEVVPPAAASIVAQALRQYLAGDNDITRNLGLRPGRGVRHSNRREQKKARDSHIRFLFQMLPGLPTARAKQVACWLAEPPKKSEITEAEVMAHVLQLHQEHGADLPKSWEQILRVVGKGD